MTPGLRRAALGGIVGPAAFAGTWLGAGFVKARYSPLHDPISELAAVHASTRVAMTGAFVVFAGGMCCYARALRSAPMGAAWVCATASGLATLGVAAFPLHHSAFVDRLHGICAGTGYVTLAATALLCARHAHLIGDHASARLAAVCGSVSAVSLALTLTGSFGGFFQRAGLTAGDVWIVTSALALRRGQWEPVRRAR